jgi:hypothetical protein
MIEKDKTINISETNFNALDALKKRQLDFMPVHFKHTEVSQRDKNKIVSWVQNKLNGRFAVANLPRVDSNDKLIYDPVIGFEDEKELTYFMLACPFTRRK